MQRKYTVRKISEEVDDILAFLLGSDLSRNVSQHSSDQDEEFVYYVAFPNKISIYHYFQETLNLHEYMEEFLKIFKKNESFKKFA